MFVDENSVWPRPEPERMPHRPEGPTASSRRVARRFLILALVVALLPFSPATLALLIRFLLGG